MFQLTQGLSLGLVKTAVALALAEVQFQFFVAQQSQGILKHYA